MVGPALGQSAGYYASAEGRTGHDLRTALHTIIRTGTVVIPYSAPASTTDTGDALRVLDEAPGNSSAVLLIYSGLTAPKPDLNNTTGWDREHLWPNSYGIDSVGPAYSDLHNLRPCDSTVNSSRGNNPYDDSNPQGSGYTVPGHPEAPGTSRNAGTWEMPHSEKGDIARALLYMDVRYEGTNGEPDLQLTNDMATVTSTGTRMGRLASLINWHLLDPVSPEERLRNDRVDALFQRNRNPFVDRPEWVTAVFGDPFQYSVERQPAGIVFTWTSTSRRMPAEFSSDLITWNRMLPAQFSQPVSVTITRGCPVKSNFSSGWQSDELAPCSREAWRLASGPKHIVSNFLSKQHPQHNSANCPNGNADDSEGNHLVLIGQTIPHQHAGRFPGESERFPDPDRDHGHKCTPSHPLSGPDRKGDAPDQRKPESSQHQRPAPLHVAYGSRSAVAEKNQSTHQTAKHCDTAYPRWCITKCRHSCRKV
ncbi:MAG: endonuclease [Verrucomicrobiota bacterium]